jgi:hypothetical protein
MNVAMERQHPSISAEEMERRRENVRMVIRENAIEGARHGPEVDPILEAYIGGEIKVTEMTPLLKKIWNEA